MVDQTVFTIATSLVFWVKIEQKPVSCLTSTKVRGSGAAHLSFCGKFHKTFFSVIYAPISVLP
jgi:hypothetical protein